MSIDVDIVPDRRNIGIDRPYEGKPPFPTEGSKKVGLKVESVYRDEQSKWIVATSTARPGKHSPPSDQLSSTPL